MKSIISSTHDDKYLFFLPIVTYCWNKLGVDVICFMPIYRMPQQSARTALVDNTLRVINAKIEVHQFDCPEHKESTYAQCSRLYAACLDLPEDEILITSDIDMAVFNGISSLLNPQIDGIPNDAIDFALSIFGSDLVPPNQYPMCYARSSVRGWRSAMKLYYGSTSENPKSEMKLNVKTYQQCLDNLLGELDCENMRGNYWAKDQETLFLLKGDHPGIEISRAKAGTQFAENRYDRDDAFLLDRLSPDTIDYHMPRPGYEENNFNQILTVLKYHYPNENFAWLIEYNSKYIKLL